ncbi:MAG TPA: hypothetical protein VJ831_03905, partial [Jatrophihabitantaceae bacterium]|nr:hypothetical protein [Jatrophihabitantaceae bacterium]
MHNGLRRIVAGAAGALLAISLASPASAAPTTRSGLDGSQRATLRSIARDTWRFFEKDVDPTTNLPLDNLGPGSVRGTYTSSANIGVYLWAV